MDSCKFCLFALYLPFAVFAQVPASEDLDTKSKRDPVKEALEIREVRESPAKDVGEALSKIEGLSRLRKGAIANDIVLRGFESNNLGILIDGVRVYGACPGHMDPAAFHIDFAEVDYIEVSKGAADLTSQGAMAGSVNIVRKQPNSGFHLTPALQTGSFGFWNPSLTMSGGNDALQLQAGYSFRRSDPYRDGSGRLMTAVGGYAPGAAAADAFGIHTGWATVRFSPGRDQGGALSYTHQDGSGILYPYLQMDAPYDIADRLDATYEIRDLVPSLSRVRLQAYYTRVRHWMTDELRQTAIGAPYGYTMGAFAASRVLGGRADTDLARNFRVGFESYQRNWDVVGISRMKMMSGVSHSIPNVNTTVNGGYVGWERSLARRLSMAAYARIDTANMYVRAMNADSNLWLTYTGHANRTNRSTAPSANAHLRFGLTESIEAFASAASASRFPDAQERYFNRSDWVGDPGLPPVRNNEANLGLSVRRSRRYAKVLGFYSAVDNYIYVRQAIPMLGAAMAGMSPVRAYGNTDARIYGVEMTYGAALSPRWMLSGGLSLSRGSKTPRPELGVYSTTLAEMPPLRGRTSLRYGRRLWFAEVEGIAANAQRRTNPELLETPTAGYATVNVKAGWHAKRTAITLGLDNALNRFYYESLSYQRDPFRNGARVPEPGRTLFVSINYQFTTP
jgi:iron complex outermembrane receptor protein